MAGTAALPGLGAGMCFVNDHELRAGSEEIVAPPIGLHEVRRDYDVGVAVEDRLPRPQRPLQAGGGAGQHLLRLDVELLAQLRLPLAGELRRAEDGEPVGLPLSSSSRAIRAASIVLPMPTSSAIRTRTGSSLR